MRDEPIYRLDARRLIDLRALPIFRDAPAPVVTGVASLLRQLTFASGEQIQSKDTIVPRVLFLQSGTVRVVQPTREVEIEPPAQLGLYYALAGAESIAEVFAKGEVQALALETRDLVDLFEDQYPLLRSTLRETARVALAETRQRLAIPFEFAASHWKQLGHEPKLDLVERLFYLREMVGAPGMSIDALASIARQMRGRRVKAGEAIWRQGDPALELLLIASGSVAARSETETLVHESGGPLGGLEVFAQAPRWYDLDAKSDVLILETPSDAILDMVEEHPEIGSGLVASLARSVLRLRKGSIDVRSTNPHPPKS